MSRKIKFYIVDVFSKGKYTGNQLAVFINSIGICSEEMQQIAHEINFSETTFVNPTPNADGSYNVRIFTPVSEVDFAGHPTLGSAFIISEKITNNYNPIITLNLKVGKITVKKAVDILSMQQITPKFGKIFDTHLLAEMLEINLIDIDNNFPIEEVSTGLPFTIVPLNSMEALRKCRMNQTFYKQFIEQAWAKGVLVFAKGAYVQPQSIVVRVFVDYLGISEDPATGSGNGCLAGYLVKHSYFNKQELDITVGQGYEINKPSELYLKASLYNDNYSIHVGGKTELVAEGYWE
jgi:trans-2,3-dihydro-3-hydroxyanthranilate isomerase